MVEKELHLTTNKMDQETGPLGDDSCHHGDLKISSFPDQGKPYWVLLQRWSFSPHQRSRSKVGIQLEQVRWGNPFMENLWRWISRIVQHPWCTFYALMCQSNTNGLLFKPTPSLFLKRKLPVVGPWSWSQKPSMSPPVFGQLMKFIKVLDTIAAVETGAMTYKMESLDIREKHENVINWRVLDRLQPLWRLFCWTRDRVNGFNPYLKPAVVHVINWFMIFKTGDEALPGHRYDEYSGLLVPSTLEVGNRKYLSAHHCFSNDRHKIGFYFL